MQYQPILKDGNALLAIFGDANDFHPHRHYEIEIMYCVSGSYRVGVNNETFLMHEGDMIYIPSFVPHESYRTEENAQVLLIEAGPAYLGNFFAPVSSMPLMLPFFSLKSSELGQKLKVVLDEIVEARLDHKRGSELIIWGNTFKFFGLMVQEYLTEEEVAKPKEYAKIKNISKALDLIHYHYAESITVDQAAAAANYGKSNFCRIFKNSIGMGFHQYLNHYRVERSKIYLQNSLLNISQIAEIVGFGDSKNFCRVFKEITGMTPGGFAKQSKN